ncbi:hypothetical protein [Vibrio quintilis]|uniref:Uncharacterized protein n=1 Tax=Vibrio quintilis TaxID=1117707 RepID=A0A1M7Z2E3_9VIBR|nr:hypothetical protein [Vibrio quintilis]SHO59128.1 hypothetical protein VQ7734_04905 [Vibrio quintilis]
MHLTPEQIECGFRGIARCREVLKQHKDMSREKRQKMLARIAIKANQLPDRIISSQ